MDQQEDPPYPEKGFTPKMMSFFDDLSDYLIGQRVVEGDGIKITDADGGGKKINFGGDTIDGVIIVINGTGYIYTIPAIGAGVKIV